MAEVRPLELARLLELAERPRSGGWSFRAALTRYAQPQAERASVVVELLRRTEGALARHAKSFEREGPAVWRSFLDGDDGEVVALLQIAAELDRLGDALAGWAVDRAGARPDAVVDGVIAGAGAGLDRLGVAREDRPPPAARRRGV